MVFVGVTKTCVTATGSAQYNREDHSDALLELDTMDFKSITKLQHRSLKGGPWCVSVGCIRLRRAAIADKHQARCQLQDTMVTGSL